MERWGTEDSGAEDSGAKPITPITPKGNTVTGNTVKHSLGRPGFARFSVRAGLAVAVGLGASIGLAGCGLLPRAQSCVSWVAHETPQEVFDEADFVVTGRVAPAHTTRSVFGYGAAVHEVTVAQVLKGDVDAKEPLEVASTPATCSGDDVYPEGDPLDVEGNVVLFLIDPEATGEWRLLTPFDGVLGAGPDGAPPPLDAW